jgi:glycosyltransferase involved in cell wall biosynthesis
MVNNPTVTVIIPLYNGEKYILRTLNSVLNQSFKDFEILVVNDGSKDNGSKIIEELSNPKITLFNQVNSGVSAARNKGIELGKGIYFAFLDADDEWDEFFLEKLVNLTKKFPKAGIYTSGYRLLFPSGPNVEITLSEKLNNKETLLVSDYFNRANGGPFVQTSGVIIPRIIIEELGNFIVGKQWGEDIEMWARIALKYDIAYDTNILFTYHQTLVDKKPRLSEYPTYQLHLLMLENEILVNSNYNSDVYVKRYISIQYLRSIQWFVLNSNKNVTTDFIISNNVIKWVPLLSRVIRYKLVWSVYKSYCYILKILNSRKFLSIAGGSKNKKGVLVRLVRNE